jgi:hypothetical protein
VKEVVDLGEVLIVHDEKPKLWMSPAPGVDASPRLIEAFRRGEVTEGGLAEAGWRWIGNLNDEGT